MYRPLFLKFLLRKAGFYVLSFFIALSLTWLLPRLMPGDPIRRLTMKIVAAGTAGGSASTAGFLTESQVKRLYEYWVREFELDKPLHIQYISFIMHCFTLNFGVSIRYYPTRVTEIIAGALPWSLALLIPAIIVGWFLGNYLGALAAYKRGIFDHLLYPFFLFIAQSPHYWLALIMVYIFGFYLRWFPLGRAYSPTFTFTFTLDAIVEVVRHYTLPFLSVMLPYVGGEAIGMRALILYEMGSDYANYCESLGFNKWKILKYAFKNAILPQVTGLPLYFAAAFGGQIVTEVVFGYPGIGSLLYEAVLGQDYPLIQGCFFTIVAVTIIGNFLMDILYAYIDPRIKLGYLGEK